MFSFPDGGEEIKTAALLTLFLACLLGTGCDRTDAPDRSRTNASAPPPAATLEATVWGPEIEAQRYEQTFVQLADDLRRATDKPAVLAQFKFDRIVIPRPDGPARELPMGLRQQRFTPPTSADRPPFQLSHRQWQDAVTTFQRAGWDLVQAEWQHERFSPATNSLPARSEFQFELHGEQVSQTNRFIIRGLLTVEWQTETHQAPAPRILSISNLSLLERTGLPGFDHHLVLAPEPDRIGGQVNLHPVLVHDLNADSHDDIALPSINQVLLNDGQANFRRTLLIKEEHFRPPQNVGVLADFNGDEKLDLLTVGSLGPLAKMLALYAGHGSLPFQDPPTVAWPEQQTNFGSWQIQAASVLTVGDIDHDQDLDVFVAQYRPPYVGGQLPTPYYDANDGYRSFLLLNDGHGNFGLAPEQPALLTKDRRRTLSASLVDLDDDADLDLVTCNDYSGVDLYRNDGRGHFRDDTAQLPNRFLFGMGSSLVDLDRDGQIDIFATGMSIPTVHRLDALGLAPAQFPDRTARRTDMGYGNRIYLRQANQWRQPPWGDQLARTGWSWGTSALDADNNGFMDLYVANGHVSGHSIADYDSTCWTHDIYTGNSQEDPVLQRHLDRALRSLNNGRTSWAGYLHNAFFVDVRTNEYVNAAFLMGLAHQTDCRAVVAADLNEDGRQDLILTEARWMGTPNLMRHRLLIHLNQLRTPHHWVGVKLVDAARSAIGTKVRARSGQRHYLRSIVTGDSYQIQGTSTVHFGLGDSAQLDEIQILWADGEVRSIPNPAVDRYYVVRRK